ncbi:MAG: ABC transporter permease [Oscillatoriales cyanobacterium SM2_2_1]|nr:ABC transporter permease [Oscillatoriales cyanobacterium SM2_2_1]
MLRAIAQSHYLLKETLIGIQRGGWMNWAAISTVAVLLFLFGASLQVSWQLESVLTQMGNQLEVSVYLKENVAADSLHAQLLKTEGVAYARVIPREEAWQKLLQDLGQADVGTATQQLGANPLVDEFKVQVRTPELLAPVAQRIAQLPGIGEVWYTNEVVERLSELRRALTNSGSVLVVIFTLVAIAVITTTIRLIVLARRQEIEVMQLVGATNLWIYLPFVLQGTFFGLAGAAIAYATLAIILNLITELLVNQPELIRSLTLGLVRDLRVQFLLPLTLLIFGAGVGVLGSLLAVRRQALN